MRKAKNPLQHYIVQVLNQPRLAWAVTMPLSCFDATSWIALSLLMLIILRFGLQAAWNLMLANFVVNAVCAYIHHPNVYVLVEALLNYWPGYLSAIVLYYSRSWHWVAYSWIGFALIMSIGLDAFLPSFAEIQLKGILLSAEQVSTKLPVSPQSLFDLVQAHQDLALHLILGLWMLSAIFNACMALTMARSMQSQIFYPGGFMQEMMSLRGCRWMMLILVLACFLVFQLHFLTPIYMMPSLLLYLFAVGLSIGVSALSKNRIQVIFALLILAALLMPYIFIPIFIGMGAIDSFVNFRFLLAKRVKTS